MSISIDGKIHKSIYKVRYGEPFPKEKRSQEMYSKTYGNVLVYIIELGQPKWTNHLTVEIPFKFYIQQIIKPSKKYENKKKRNKVGLKLIK